MSKSVPTKALQALGLWFERQKRVLPWRDEPTLYRVWISEIMLQQTQVVTVVPYFERFLERFPRLERLAAAEEQDVLAMWAGLGYYSRARNILKAAKQIAAAGDFPRDREGWLEVPGVGQYTAGAILSIALDQPEAILDGNVERVLSRLRRVTRASGDVAYKSALWELSRDSVTRAAKAGVRPSVFNQALMELGAIFCTPKSPKCLLCPLASACDARKEGDPEAYPPRKAPKKWLAVEELMLCAIDEKGRVLLRLREAGEWRAGLWDFPERAKAHLGAAGSARERKKGAELLGEIETQHVVTRHKIRRKTEVWRVSRAQSVAWAERAGAQWIALAGGPKGAAPEVPAGSAVVKTISRVRERFPEAWPVS